MFIDSDHPLAKRIYPDIVNHSRQSKRISHTNQFSARGLDECHNGTNQRHPRPGPGQKNKISKEVLKLTENAKEDLKKKLTPLQFHVTQQCGTEPPFNNQFWNNKKPGIYVDVVSGEPLFS